MSIHAQNPIVRSAADFIHTGLSTLPLDDEVEDMNLDGEDEETLRALLDEISVADLIEAVGRAYDRLPDDDADGGEPA